MEFETATFDRYTQFKSFYIHAERYHDKRVLLADGRLADKKLGGNNYVIIEAKGTDGKRYYPDLYISTKNARKYPAEEMDTRAGGTIKVRAVPLSAFKELKISERSIHDL